MRSLLRYGLTATFLLSLAGCSILTEGSALTSNLGQLLVSSGGASKDKNGPQVANPPARTIRFDGHEIVLGDAADSGIETTQLVQILQPLVDQQRLRTASSIIENHRESSERLLFERWAAQPSDPLVRCVATVLSRRGTQPAADWNSLLQLAVQQPQRARAYLEFRNAFAKELQGSDPSGESAAKLQQLAQELGHPLVKIDSLRLLGLRELVSARNGWAESLCRQAVDAAMTAGHPLLAAELGLMVTEAARRTEQATVAAEAWTAAVALHVASAGSSPHVDVGFWTMAENTRPATSPWPKEVAALLAPHAARVGCSAEGGVEVVLWAAVAQAQFERGEMQLALLNFKRAETSGAGDQVMWLRIAQSRCLAAMNQVPAASAILSGPASSKNAAVAAAATAAMGSIKLQAGAYQQGAQLLTKALSQNPASTWPFKHQAQADLALAQLIIGDTQAGLDALHAAQSQFAQAGNQLELIRSLENERRLLEHEERPGEAAAIASRITQLERL
jgi:tetratricopeptide (TPR) repeat protein